LKKLDKNWDQKGILTYIIYNIKVLLKGVRTINLVLVSCDVWGKKESYSLMLLLVNFSMNFVAGIFVLIHGFGFLFY